MKKIQHKRARTRRLKDIGKPYKRQYEGYHKRPKVKYRKPHNYKWVPTDEDVRKIERLAGQGLNYEQICLVLGISVSTFAKNRKLYSEINEAIKRGRAKAIAIVTNSLFNKAENGDLGSQVFWLKNQAGWRDRVSNEITGPDGGPIQTQTDVSFAEHTDEERAARLAQILNAARERGVRQAIKKKKGH